MTKSIRVGSQRVPRSALITNWFWVLSTWLFVLAILALVLISGVTNETGIEGSNSGGNLASLTLVSVAILPLFFSRLEFVSNRWIPWMVGGLSAVLGLALSLLSLIGPQGLAWSMYGGLRVLRAPDTFNDLTWVFRWVECDGCESEYPGYGAGALWLKPLTLGLIRENWSIPIGFTLILVLSIALYWLSKVSPSGALPIYLLASFSSAWLLLLDRANIDAVVFLIPFAVLYVYRRHQNLAAWFLIALAIWWLGTWKYYPFALGVLLLPLFQIRRGWIVLLAFLGATFTFVFMSIDTVSTGLSNNLQSVIIDDFPAYGRIPIVARMSSSGQFDSIFQGHSLLVFGMAIAAFFWGIRFSRTVKQVNWIWGLVAMAGSGIFIANVLIGGFGFAYKGAFLLLTVPLIALGVKSRDKFAMYSSLVALVLLVISLILSYSILLTSIASILVAAFGFGAGFRISSHHLTALYFGSRRPTGIKSH